MCSAYLLQSFLSQQPNLLSQSPPIISIFSSFAPFGVWGERGEGSCLTFELTLTSQQRLAPRLGRKWCSSHLKQGTGIRRGMQGTMGWTSATREVPVKPDFGWKLVTDQPKFFSLQRELLGENLWCGSYRKVDFDRQNVSFGLKSSEALHLLGERQLPAI